MMDCTEKLPFSMGMSKRTSSPIAVPGKNRRRFAYNLTLILMNAHLLLIITPIIGFFPFCGDKSMAFHVLPPT